MRLPVISLMLSALCATASATDSAAEASCHSGAYQLADGTRFVVQPSDAGNLRYRFIDGTSGRLYRLSEGEYESGDGWTVREPVRLRVSFGTCEQGTVQFKRVDKPELRGNRIRLPIEPIYFASGDAKLYGELVMPVQRKPSAIVVLQFGSGHDSAVVHNYVQYLLPLSDIAVFVFDKRGTGRSQGGFTMHIGEMADDVVAAVNAVRRKSSLRDIPLGVMGESQGGWVVPLAATKTPVDFVVVSYGLAVSMLEEDRLEMEQSLRAKKHGQEVLAKGEALHRAASRVAVSRFKEGVDELERLKSAWREEPWFADIGGDFTSMLATTPHERFPELQAQVNFPYDLAFDPMPTLGRIEVPMLWVLAEDDTEAPHESTLANLQQLERKGVPIEIVVYPDAEHGMIAVEQGPAGPQLAGRTAPGYFEHLAKWISSQRRRPLGAGRSD